MQNNFVWRFVLTLTLFWVGVHLIGFAMIEVGANQPWNPTWKIFQAVWKVELSILLIFVQVMGFLFAVGAIGVIVHFTIRTFSPKPKMKISVESQSVTPEKPVTLLPEAKPKADNFLLTPAQPAIQKQTGPTPEELKQKAIQQIIRGY